MALRAAPNLEKERAAVIAAHMQRLLGTQEWDVLAQEVAAMEQQALNSARRIHKEELDHLQGRLQGILDVMTLPQKLIAHARRP
ncbi:MAG TPA: hypothetical protein VF104_03225 [Burkholderiales bacterium]